MTEIQQTNIAAANFIIDELYKEKPFKLVLDVSETDAIYQIAAASHELNNSYVNNLTIATWTHSKAGTGCQLKIDDTNADILYHMLSTYITKHDRFGVMQSLREVS